MITEHVEAVYNYLQSEPDFSTKVGSFGFMDVPQGAPVPRVTYTIISSPTSWETDDQWQRWRFYVVAEDKFDCIDIADVLSAKLNRLYGTVDTELFDFISRIDSSPVEMRDDSMYEMYIDFRVKFHE